jgi:hypothetical protein
MICRVSTWYQSVKLGIADERHLPAALASGHPRTSQDILCLSPLGVVRQCPISTRCRPPNASSRASNPTTPLSRPPLHLGIRPTTTPLNLSTPTPPTPPTPTPTPARRRLCEGCEGCGQRHPCSVYSKGREGREGRRHLTGGGEGCGGEAWAGRNRV